MKRIVLLTAALWVALYASQELVHRLFLLIPASLAENAWAGWPAVVVPLLLAAWLIGRWRGLAGRRLAITSAVAVLVACAVVAVMGTAAVSSPQPPVLDVLGGEAGIAIFYVVSAVEAVAVAWLFAGLSLRLGAHRTSAST